MRRATFVLALALVTPTMLTGCMPKMTMEEMKSMMPQRPAELDRLNAFAGKWEFEGKADMACLEGDEEVAVSGSGESKWDASGWFLVGRSTFKMADFDEMVGVETWTYDAKSKKYRSTWTDSMGAIGIGESKYHAETDSWTMKATSHGPMGKTKMKGCLKIVDDDTMEWCMAEYAMGGLMKTMEMCGTSHRK